MVLCAVYSELRTYSYVTGFVQVEFPVIGGGCVQ